MKGQNNTPFRITSDYDSIRDESVFTDLLKVLMAFAIKLIGDSTLRLAKNKADLAYDMAMESIQRHLEDPSKFNPSRNPDLVQYLKYYILRRLISNHKNLDGQKKEVLYENQDVNGITVENSFTEAFDIHQSIDLSDTIDKIRVEIGDDKDLAEIFDLRYTKEYTPGEIMEELKISSREYNNRIRRVDTIKRRVIRLNQQTN